MAFRHLFFEVLLMTAACSQAVAGDALAQVGAISCRIYPETNQDKPDLPSPFRTPDKE